MSHTSRRRHNQLDSSSSLAPLISSSRPPVQGHFPQRSVSGRGEGHGGSDSVDMSSLSRGTSSRRGDNNNFGKTSNGGLGLPPTPHAKLQPRVFSKKVKGGNGEPVPIPGANHGGVLDRCRSQDSECAEPEVWELSPRGSAESAFRVGSLTPSDLSFSRDFDHGSSEENVAGTMGNYLTPIDMEEPEHQAAFTLSGSLESPAGDGSFGAFGLTDRGEPRHARFDSGVGDSESDQGSRRGRFASEAPSSLVSRASTTASSSYPALRLPTHQEQHYEDIDAYKKYAQPKTTGPMERSRLPLPNGVVQTKTAEVPGMYINGVTHSDSDDTANDTVLTKRSPPRHFLDPHASLPHTYSPLDMNRHAAQAVKTKTDTVESKTKGFCCCLVLALTVIFLMTSAALGIGIYLLIKDGETSPASAILYPATNSSNSTASPQTSYGLDEALAILNTDVEHLHKENAALKSELENLKSFVKSEFQPVKSEVAFLKSQNTKTRTSIAFLQNQLTTELANISLTPGPRGPMGVANFSLCRHKSASSVGSASTQYDTITKYLPSTKDLRDNFVIFAFCTLTGASNFRLEMKQGNDSSAVHHQYRCICSGTVPGEPRTFCSVNIIQCPSFHSQTEVDSVP